MAWLCIEYRDQSHIHLAALISPSQYLGITFGQTQTSISHFYSGNFENPAGWVGCSDVKHLHIEATITNCPTGLYFFLLKIVLISLILYKFDVKESNWLVNVTLNLQPFFPTGQYHLLTSDRKNIDSGYATNYNLLSTLQKIPMWKINDWHIKTCNFTLISY